MHCQPSAFFGNTFASVVDSQLTLQGISDLFADDKYQKLYNSVLSNIEAMDNICKGINRRTSENGLSDE
jgi:hypothetical protein